jgi:cytochrome oxidase Cu insertion factor (SCO1/SenC/PrrC family)
MTFVYTACADVCPAAGAVVAQVLRKVGPGVELYAITVDPEGDNAPRARAFLQRVGAAGLPVHFLLGTRRQLAPVWTRYGIVPVAMSPREAAVAARAAQLRAESGATDPIGPPPGHLAEALAKQAPALRDPYPDPADGRYRGRLRHDDVLFEHSAYVLLVDKHGRQRVGFPFEQVDPALLEHDLRTLRAEP